MNLHLLKLFIENKKEGKTQSLNQLSKIKNNRIWHFLSDSVSYWKEFHKLIYKNLRFCQYLCTHFQYY